MMSTSSPFLLDNSIFKEHLHSSFPLKCLEASFRNLVKYFSIFQIMNFLVWCKVFKITVFIFNNMPLMFRGTFKIKCKLPLRNHWQISKLLTASVSIIDFNLRANESEGVSSVKIKICTEILKYILYILNILFISPQNSWKEVNLYWLWRDQPESYSRLW